MGDNFNTIAGWVLAAGIVALGSSIASGIYFEHEAIEKPGYAVADAEPADGGGGAAAIPIGVMMASADVAKGAEVFKKCAACHTIAQGGANGIGPNLWGVMGKPHGGGAGFAYSDAIKAISGPWNFDNMNAWMISPRKYAPGTKMTFAGLGKPEDRANVIAYLNANGSNLPLPTPEAAPAAGDPATPTDEGAVPDNGTAPADNAAAPAANAAAPAANASTPPAG